MTTTSHSPLVILIAGHWLGAWAWDEVLAQPALANANTVAVTLPGLDPDDDARTTKNIGDQAAAILRLIAEHGNQPTVLVAHSGANAPVSVVLDRHPELVGRVVWVDSGPVLPGSAFAPDFPEESPELPLPDFETLGQQASLAGLSDQALERFRLRAVPQPGPALRQAVELTNDGRRRVPTTFVCCSISAKQVRELAQARHPMFAEVATLTDVAWVDLPTGHWPMWSTPRELADVIAGAARRAV
ncbi:alpha/beta fold hydrolase [Leucobacter albus]|uniref:Alpha/beta fold hydrolase n=1 Tax=Leucobacter albus TaxID=272210 RepID=A0ABW3TNH5_9MICO